MHEKGWMDEEGLFLFLTFFNKCAFFSNKTVDYRNCQLLCDTISFKIMSKIISKL